MDVDGEELVTSTNAMGSSQQRVSSDNNNTNVLPASAALARVPLTNSSIDTSQQADTSLAEQRSISSVPATIPRPAPLVQPASQGRTLELPRPTRPQQRHYNPRLVPIRMRRLNTELRDMVNDPPPNCTASPKGDDLSEWIATVAGPEGSVYEGGTFFMDVTFPDHYPYTAPRIRFKTKIYHCNINSHGIICLDILKEKWCPALTLSKILLSITSLLWDANPEDPLVGSIARLYLSDREEHDRNARIWTEKYAK